MKRNPYAIWILGTVLMLTLLPGGCPTGTQALSDLSANVAGDVVVAAEAVRSAVDAEADANRARDDDDDDYGDGDEDDCLAFVLPVTYELPDGSQLVIEGDFGWALLDAWYETYGDEEEEPELQFPVDVMFEGETITVADDDALHELEETCYGDEEECLEPVLPITFVLPDGSEIVIETDEDYDLLEQWYEENPDSEEEPQLQFPIDVFFEEEVVTVEDEEQLHELEEACYGDEHEDCYEPVLPLTFVLPDGSEIVIETEEDFDLLDQWYEANPDSEEEPQLQFPIEIIIGDEVITVTDQEQLEAIEADCEDC